MKFTGICTAFQLGYMAPFIAIWLVGAVIRELELSATKAGLLVSAEFLAIAVAAMGIAPFADRFSVKRVAITGAILIIAANITSIAFENYELLLISRTLAGIGGGLAMAMGSAALARYPNPERSYAAVQIVGAVVAAIILYTAGYAVSSFGYRGVFGLYVLYCAIGLFLLLFLQPDSGHSESSSRTAIPRLFGTGGVLIAVMFIFMVMMGSTWSFLETKGHDIGLAQEQLSWIFGISSLVGISGAILSSWINIRFGRLLPVSLSFTLASVVFFTLFGYASSLVYQLSLFTMQVLWFFCLPYIFGAAAALDGTGRVAAALTSSMLVGLAFGPIVGGYLWDFSGLISIGQFASIGCVVAMLLMFVVIYQIKPLPAQ